MIFLKLLAVLAGCVALFFAMFYLGTVVLWVLAWATGSTMADVSGLFLLGIFVLLVWGGVRGDRSISRRIEAGRK